MKINRLLTLFTAAAISLSAFAFSHSYCEAENKITLSDVQTALKMSLCILPKDNTKYDMDNDGDITLNDVTIALKYALCILEFPNQETKPPVSSATPEPVTSSSPEPTKSPSVNDEKEPCFTSEYYIIYEDENTVAVTIENINPDFVIEYYISDFSDDDCEAYYMLNYFGPFYRKTWDNNMTLFNISKVETNGSSMTFYISGNDNLDYKCAGTASLNILYEDKINSNDKIYLCSITQYRHNEYIRNYQIIDEDSIKIETLNDNFVTAAGLDSCGGFISGDAIYCTNEGSFDVEYSYLDKFTSVTYHVNVSELYLETKGTYNEEWTKKLNDGFIAYCGYDGLGGDKLDSLKLPEADKQELYTLYEEWYSGNISWRTIKNEYERIRFKTYPETFGMETWNALGTDQAAHIYIIKGKPNFTTITWITGHGKYQIPQVIKDMAILNDGSDKAYNAGYWFTDIDIELMFAKVNYDETTNTTYIYFIE